MSTILDRHDVFSDRHIGPNDADTDKMVAAIGVASLDDLINKTVPASIRLPKPLDLPAPQSEFDFLHSLKKTAQKNKVYKSYIGMGYYGTITPPVVLRNVLENPGWYTQYTPYQAEIAQGRLESLLNYQTMIIDLTGLEIANASLLDEGTAAAEAMHLMHAIAKPHQTKLFVSNNLFPQTIDVLKTRCEPLGVEMVIGHHTQFAFDESYMGAVIQYPDDNGEIYDYRSFCEDAHKHNALVCVCADLMALALITPPGEFGADIAVGSAQRFGVPMGYGGPHAAYFATKEAYKRQMPGRIIGVSIDAQGNRALRMALQTREQHIKRDKATSNICTAQALLSNMAAMYAVYHGQRGIKAIASRIHAHTQLLAHGVKELGLSVRTATYFDTLRIDLGDTSKDTVRTVSEANGMNFRYYSDNSIGISLDETTDINDVDDILRVLASASGKKAKHLNGARSEVAVNYPAGIARTSAYLTHPVFNRYHSETEMLRYIKMLENKDLSLTHSMIALGSCTMKLNATSEMIPVTWSEFGNLHPFAPLDQATGYMEVFDGLEKALCEITGFDAMSLQPNAGAQGEYTGLLVIRAYHRSRGDHHRTIAIIPASAHGTNPASAVMAGMKVVVVASDAHGHIDMNDLRAKAEQHKDDLSCLMVTYPSTHGVFEEEIKEICDVIHEHGGLVYMDGANMNAQVGLTSPRMIGADVCHLNLHKTFCIPHGGGGPGMGPIGVTKELAPFLPGHAVVPMGKEHSITAVSAAPWGSASILLISWAYISMMGGEGLTKATKYAILNANYMKARLEKEYDILYTGANGFAAHEMIVDLRKFKAVGIEAEDVAKRLMDYGFHAPTLSFPVPGTIMIEPTESESLEELDRFCDALIHIRHEIAAIENGTADKTDNVLKNAPHTQFVVTADEWSHSYTRQHAAFPAPFVRLNKFWASVGRVNNTHGDRVLICACPPMEEYMDAEITA
ncbi:MAG: aminomethyl-transferring glycine dehydrogenase [Candidatus Kapabacteria bacterium]|nr:aminomethyl-transferring glycine dehydrogenase [Candidatus Kapabacteria bacterium]